MHWIDWTIVAVFAVALVALGIYVKRFNKSVADFLVTNRSSGRYLLTISEGATFLAGVNIIAAMQRDYRAGFCTLWWLLTLTQPLSLLVGLSGWVVYRYRETRAMTMAQLLEIRYSRRFRVFAGILAWTAGVANMGVFPAVTGKFFMYYFNLPETFSLLGIDGIPTFPAIMIAELSISLILISLGGMIVVAITDFFQGIFCIVSLLVILVALAAVFNWDQVLTTLTSTPEMASKMNPFKTSRVEAFDTWYFLIFTFMLLYGTRTFLGAQGYSGAARSAHESKMAVVLGKWRYMIQTGLLILLPICVFVYMNNADFSDGAAEVNQVLAGIENQKVAEQVRCPLAMRRFLPIGIIGLFGAFFLAATVSTDDTFLHSWGSILVQDVILPFRKKGLTPKQHMWLLRGSMVLVAAIIFCISLFFRQVHYLYMYFSITAAIFMGGAGSVVIGALYWKRGSTKAAWGGMIVGSSISVGGIIISQIWPNIVESLRGLSNCQEFPMSGWMIVLAGGICGLGIYVASSLLAWAFAGRAPLIYRLLLRRNNAAATQKKQPATGAWVGLIIAAVIACGGLLLSHYWASQAGPTLRGLFARGAFLDRHAKEFVLNAQKIAFIGALSAIATYVGLSLFDWLVLRKPPFNMDRMLHRGKYTIKGEHEARVTQPPSGLRALLPGKEYSPWDKFLHMSLVLWSLALLGLGIVVAIIHFGFGGISDDWWPKLWKNSIYFFAAFGVITTVWFLGGGLRDLKRLFRRLGTMERNELDDGRVEDHQSLADKTLLAETPEAGAEAEDSAD